MTGCTFVGNTAVNDGFGHAVYGPAMDIVNTIIRGPAGEQIDGTVDSVTYSNIQYTFAGTGNIDLDPLFVTGPGGDYYLSSIAAGDPADSPSLDAGTGTMPTGYTSTSDRQPDSGTRDQGYHYASGGDYTLTLTDMDASSFGCGTDAAAPDAFYEFQVAAGSPTVRIEPGVLGPVGTSPDPANCTWHRFGSEGYYVCGTSGTGRANRATAAANCAAVGMELARVDSLEESNFIGALRVSHDIYIGGTDFTEDEWIWPDGANFWDGKHTGMGGSAQNGLFSRWANNEPNGDSEDCASVKADGYWNDINCNNTLPYACEFDLPAGSLQDIAYTLYDNTDTALDTCRDVATDYVLTPGTYYVHIKGKDAAAAADPASLTLRDTAINGVIECDAGTEETPGRITRTLDPGKYWVGLTGNTQGVPDTSGAYTITIRDLGMASTYATQMGCSTGPATYSLTDGTKYYAVVKGASVAESGAYDLDVKELNAAVSPMDCGDTDPAAPDAFYHFSVADVAGRNIAIDMEGSSLDASFQLYTAADDQPVAGGCGTTSGGGFELALPGGGIAYYVRIKGNNSAEAEDVFELNIRDADRSRGVSCSPGTSATGGDITALLDTGTYYVGITGRQAFTPAGLADLYLWFDGNDTAAMTLSGDLVQDWTDAASGETLTAPVGREPILIDNAANGRSAVRFRQESAPAAGDHAVLSKSLAGALNDSDGLSIFAVSRLRNPESYDNGSYIIAGSHAAGGHQTFDVGTSAGAPGADIRMRVHQNGATSTGASIAAAPGPSQMMLTGGVFRTNNSLRTYYNGTAGPTSGGVGTYTWDTLSLGGSMDADVFEVIVVTREVSTAERENIEGYLAAKWGIADQLPPAHPGVSRQGQTRIMVEDMNYGGNFATRLGCATSAEGYTMDVPVVANRDYYAVIKGVDPGDENAFSLDIADVGAVRDIGCTADPLAPDAYFDFSVTDVDRTVSVDVTNSSLASPAFAVYQDPGTPGDLTDDVFQGCSNDSQSFTDLPTGDYYVVAKGTDTTNGAAEDSVEVEIRDTEGVGSLVCDDSGGGLGASITHTFSTGTYYVGMTTQGGATAGDYKVTFADTSVSAPGGAVPIACEDVNRTLDWDVTANTPYYVVVKGVADADEGTYTLTATDIGNVTAFDNGGGSGPDCGTDLSAPDAHVAFSVANGAGRAVTISIEDSVLGGAFQLYESDGTPVGDCSATRRSYANLPQGDYYVVVRGTNVASGQADLPFDLWIRDDDGYGSIDCVDATAGSTSAISRTLNPGKYWVGVSTRGGSTPGAYAVEFEDANMLAVPGAVELGCDTGTLDYTVTAGTPYYVVVKGDTAVDEGEYGLSITDLNGAEQFGCNDDPSEGDAWFEFDVDDINGRTLTIDTEGSVLDTSIAIFSAGAPAFDAANAIACDQDSGTGEASLLNVTLAQGKYYAIVRADLDAADANAAFELSIRDDDVMISDYCDDDGGAGQTRILQTLQPGTYNVVLGGHNPAPEGNYELTFQDYGPIQNSAGAPIACDSASDTISYNVTADTPYYVVVKGDQAADAGNYQLTVENIAASVGLGCGADPLSADVFYRFSLTQQTRVRIETAGSAIGTAIGLYRGDATYFGTNYAKNVGGFVIDCDSNGSDSVIEDDLDPGDYYVLLKSTSSTFDGNPHEFKVAIRDANTNAAIDCAPAGGALTRTLAAGKYYAVVSNEDATGGDYSLTFTDTSTLPGNAATEVACEEMTDEIVHDVTANTPYYVVVKGDQMSDAGAYGMFVESADTNSATMGCGADPAAPDAFFKFALTQESDVILDTNGSTMDTVIALYHGSATSFGINYADDVYGVQTNCDDDGGATLGASRMTYRLAPGEYYMVLKGKTAFAPAEDFSVSIRDETAGGFVDCASAFNGAKVVSLLAAGDYTAVVSGQSMGGGAYDLVVRNLDESGGTAGTPIACADDQLDSVPVSAGQDYFLVVKGDEEAYELSVKDDVAESGNAGDVSIACASENAGTRITGTYPAGTYYALVTGEEDGDWDVANDNDDDQSYEMYFRDNGALADNNRIACDNDSGPNGTSALEADLESGTHYVVIKGEGPGDVGPYQLNIRDVDAVPDHQLDCADPSSGERIEYNVQAGQDYTLVLKGDGAGQSGAYNLKAYDEAGEDQATGSFIACSADGQDLNAQLTPDTYYLTLKGQEPDDHGPFQVNMGDITSKGDQMVASMPTWAQMKDELADSGVKVMTVYSSNSNPGRDQMRAIAEYTDTVDDTGQGIVQRISSNGSGIGSGLVSAIADLAGYLAMDISVGVVFAPDAGASGFVINVAARPSSGCDFPLLQPQLLKNCYPGSTPRFEVSFTNPWDTPVPPNPSDPFGGYHFKLQIVGNAQYVLEEIPVYIIPTDIPGPMPMDENANSFDSMGFYTQDVYGSGCVYDLEEKAGPASCADGMDNDGDGAVDMDDLDCVQNGDEGSGLGSCLDGMDNDGANGADQSSPECQPAVQQDWSDVFFKAEVPDGTRIEFDMCSGETVSDLDSCTFENVITVTGSAVPCANNGNCQGVAGMNGYCSEVGNCQFISPPKRAGACAIDAQCENGPLPSGDYYIQSYCDQMAAECVYVTPPGDIASAWDPNVNANFLPNVRVRIGLFADDMNARAPTLREWYVTYNCRSAD